ncbi:YdhK family protein [Nesterenkonia sp. HG001]|uniref:YdhK family protein n=1 Tax=Nesterenkonia sp. HG001 TaxID=2983207 RepID=UPI002AC5D9BB|nr:YdhK family protein [Nesterenkonia sp. HG001]MDZ5079058.1 YdhK family protein [Nesterenkonia sp. HG001]
MARTLTTTLATGALTATLVLAGCASDNTNESTGAQDHGNHDNGHNGDTTDDTATEGEAGQDHDGHDHPVDGGPVPQGMSEATDPLYPVGSEAVLTADHMSGMDGATATIVGAYDTYTYAVNYTPTTGGDPVLDHRWVVHEELQNVGQERLADGTEVTLAAEHMSGMDGATATIASSTQETVYVVDFESDGMAMTNHKWVTESEIDPSL